MRILHAVETYNPFTSGMQEVVQRISELLASRGHQVTVATTAMPERHFSTYNGVEVVQFDIHGNCTLGYRGSAAARDEYQKLLLSKNFDVITGFAAQQWSVDLMLPILQQISAATVFVPTGFSGLQWRAYKKYYRSMPTWLSEFSANVAITRSYRDAQYMHDHEIKNAFYIPNGASVKEFEEPADTDIRKALNIPKNHILFLHVGSHTGVKGHAEMIKAFRKAKLPPATLLIVGTEPPNGCASRCRRATQKHGLLTFSRSQSEQEIQFVTLRREETVAAFQAADIFLFLSNIECSPIVLFESMAARTPFICTDVGNTKEIASEGSGTGIIVKTHINRKGMSYANIASAIDAIEQLGNNTVLREKLGSEGHRAWKEKHTWGSIAVKYENLYTQLLQRKQSSL
ncbi:MAG: glycosyltransferase family 4 protein [Patescibacteria group bacterium]